MKISSKWISDWCAVKLYKSENISHKKSEKKNFRKSFKTEAKKKYLKKEKSAKNKSLPSDQVTQFSHRGGSSGFDHLDYHESSDTNSRSR